jgi:NADPH2:quinone reductase
VIGTTRSKKAPLDGLLALEDAASPSLEDRVRALAPGGVAAVFDSRAGATLAQSHRMVRRGGRLVVFGLSSAGSRGLRGKLATLRSLCILAGLRLFPRGRRTVIFAIDKVFRKDPARVHDLVAARFAELAKGLIAPIVGLELPLADASRALALLERGEVVGKIVLRA